MEKFKEQLPTDQERIAQLEEALRVSEEGREQWRTEAEKWHELAIRDPLTNTLNRRGLEEAAAIVFNNKEKKEDQGKREYKKPVGVLLLDVDNFKVINDAFEEGHSGGDRILQEAANFLKNAVRGSDVIARIGGEEFAIIFKGASAQDIYNKFFDTAESRARLGFVATLDGEEIPINFSGGISMFEPGETIDDLDVVIGRADRALFKAKRGDPAREVSGRDQLLIDSV